MSLVNTTCDVISWLYNVSDFLWGMHSYSANITLSVTRHCPISEQTDCSSRCGMAYSKGIALIFWEIVNLLVAGDLVEGQKLVPRTGVLARGAIPMWNELVDRILKTTQDDMARDGHHNISLPDLLKPFEFNLGTAKIAGQLTATGGVLLGITSFRRNGNVVAYTTPDWGFINLQFNAGMRNFTVRYEQCQVDIQAAINNCGEMVNIFKYRTAVGAFEGKVNTNNIQANYTFLRVNEGCESTLNSLRITRLDGVNVRVTGLGPLNTVVSGVMSAAAEDNKNLLAVSLEKAVGEGAAEMLKTFECDAVASLFIS